MADILDRSVPAPSAGGDGSNPDTQAAPDFPRLPRMPIITPDPEGTEDVRAAAGMMSALRQAARGMRQDAVAQAHRTTSQALEDAKSQAADLSSAMKTSVTGQMSSLTGKVQEDLGHARAELGGLSAKLGSVFTRHQPLLAGLLNRLQSGMTLPAAPEVAGEVERSGLNQPLDSLTLARLGVVSEDELLRKGLDPELLPILRSVVTLYGMAPAVGGEDNCIPYAIMLGYLYEALIRGSFHKLYQHLRLPKTNLLSAYDTVEWDRCVKMADCGRFRDGSLRSLRPEDWAAWLNLCQCCRILRNRLHSNKGEPGYISRQELDALYCLMLCDGADNKERLLALPCFGPNAPAGCKQFTPAIPAQWPGADPADPHGTLRRHISANGSRFHQGMISFLLGCGDMTD